ncbi:hypothetical protein WIA93_10390 [Citrobacter amalonaticus]|uniref:DUF6945 domain-containing protein n=1 Tax=Citrobacter amalonaticus TaxID=35703 RepID=UPI00115BF0CE|nr:hypothetical protein [Citrobacter amalonaticus]QDK86579.1 hypothetical protein FEO47_14305 [Citrobacter amalonaticus]
MSTIRPAPQRRRTKKEDVRPFYMGDKCLAHAASVTVKSTGEHIELPTNNLYNVYCYLWDQYRGYQAIGAEFFESQDNIARKTKIDRQSIYKKIFPQLEALGLLKRVKKGRGYSYIVFDVADVADNLIFNFDTLDDGVTPTYEPERVSGKAKKVKEDEHSKSDAKERSVPLAVSSEHSVDVSDPVPVSEQPDPEPQPDNVIQLMRPYQVLKKWYEGGDDHSATLYAKQWGADPDDYNAVLALVGEHMKIKLQAQIERDKALEEELRGQ